MVQNGNHFRFSNFGGQIDLLKANQTQDFNSKTSESSSAIPGAFKQVNFYNLEFVEAGDIDWNSNHFRSFLVIWQSFTRYWEGGCKFWTQQRFQSSGWLQIHLII